ncbi:MAG: hypothetical protein ACK5AZ_23300 [Bryobacteraceae bacterium]
MRGEYCYFCGRPVEVRCEAGAYLVECLRCRVRYDVSLVSQATEVDRARTLDRMRREIARQRSS